MKKMTLILILLLMFSMLTGCSQSLSSYFPFVTDHPAAGSETPWLGSDMPAPAEEPAAEIDEPIQDQPMVFPEAEYLEDFTVETIDGSTFSLSDAMQDHELVLINLFATWCPPCEMEFPYLREAWSQRSDTVAVVALSIEESDSLDVLRQYAEERDLTFPMGRENGTGLGRFVTEGIPTSVLVDRTGKVALVEVGAKFSAEEFYEIFDAYTGSDYDPGVCTYTIYTYDSNYDDVPGVVINFCTDLTCTAVTTDEFGMAVFTGPPMRYHVQVISVPEGLQLYGDSEFYTEPYGQTLWLSFVGVGR